MQLAYYICGVCFYLMITGAVGQDLSITSLMQSPTNGQMTYYGSPSGGDCTLFSGDVPYPPVYANQQSLFHCSVAVVSSLFDNSAMCGACINVTSKGTGSGATPIPSGSFMVYVDNICPSCNSGGLDAGITGDGVWDMSWEVIECPMDGAYPNLQYWIAPGSTVWYLKIQVRNTPVPCSQLYITQGGVETELTKTSDNFFTMPSGFVFPLTLPLSMRLVSIYGDSITDTLDAITCTTVLQTSVQFPTRGKSVQTTASTTSSASATSSSSSSSSSSSGSGATVSVSATVTISSSVSDSISSSSSTSSSSSCNIGESGCPCTEGGACNKGLTCLSKICVDASALQNDAAFLSGSMRFFLFVFTMFSLILRP